MSLLCGEDERFLGLAQDKQLQSMIQMPSEDQLWSCAFLLSVSQRKVLDRGSLLLRPMNHDLSQRQPVNRPLSRKEPARS
jgi:hypothetical protein